MRYEDIATRHASVQSRYNTVGFPEVLVIDSPTLTRERAIWNDLFTVLYMFWLGYWCDVYNNIIPYGIITEMESDCWLYSQQSDSISVIIHVSTKHHLLFICHALSFWFLMALPNRNVNINLHRRLGIWLSCCLCMPVLKITPAFLTPMLSIFVYSIRMFICALHSTILDNGNRNICSFVIR